MKKSLLLLGILLSTNLYAARIHNYEQLVTAIENGDVIRININFDLCKTKDARIMHGFGSYTPNEMIIDMAGDVNASLTHFTIQNPLTPNHAVYEHVRYAINSSNVVQITTNVLDAATYMAVAKPVTYTCEIDDGAQIYNKS